MPKQIVVLGARGFLGEHIVQQLADSGYAVRAVVRPGSVTQFPAGVRTIGGDLADAGFVRHCLAGVDGAIFAAGRTWQPGLAAAAYHRDNVAITEAFFAALGQRPELRVVFTSSLSVIAGSRAPRIYSEDSGRDGICESRLTPYDRAKIACEAIALDSARRGNAVVILNPGLILGPGIGPKSNLVAPFLLLWFGQGAAAARFYVNGGVTLCDVRDVARAHVAALDRGRPGTRTILGGPTIDRTEFYAHVARLTGLRPPRPVPGWLVHAGAAASDAAAFITGGRIASPVPRSFARALHLYYYAASARAADELGYTTTPIDVTILDMLRHYASRGLLPESLSFVRDLTVENAPALVLLRQLAGETAHASFLLPRLAQLHAICCSNHALEAALRGLQAASTFDVRSGRFRWDAAAGRAAVPTLRRFFEYVYFASDEFLKGAV